MHRLLAFLPVAVLAVACTPPELRFVGATHADTPLTLKDYWNVRIDGATPPLVTVIHGQRGSASVTTTGKLSPAGEQRLARAVAYVEDHWDPYDPCYDDLSYACTAYEFEDLSTGMQVGDEGVGDLVPFVDALRAEIGTCASVYLYNDAGCP
jgi:hypothetical protein